MFTEEEAKHKVCPQPDIGRCLASECMAWRWSEDKIEIKRVYHSPDAPAGEGWKRYGEIGQSQGLTWQEWARLTPNRQGVCGLAGKADLTLNTGDL